MNRVQLLLLALVATLMAMPAAADEGMVDLVSDLLIASQKVVVKVGDVVDPTQSLFEVADLSSVWFHGHLYDIINTTYNAGYLTGCFTYVVE